MLILTLNIQSLSLAEDVSDLQIEGISIGDSLLDYFNEKEIKKAKQNYVYKDDSFYEAEFYKHKSFNNYENIQIGLKKNDNNYIVHKVLGFNFIKNNINKKCFNKVDLVTKEIKNILSNTSIKTEEYPHSADSSGKSLVKTAFIKHNTGEIWIECYDWSDKLTKQNNWIDNFGVNIVSNEYIFWINNKAY